ncbi:MAG: GlsB/YeaQ/YmgE family stress response membrane protein [Chloroflexota bacterium]
MGFLAWIIFGALAGWVASIITGRNSRMGCLANIFIGIIGAVLGGWLMQLITGEPFDMNFDMVSFIVAVIASSLLLAITGMFRPRRRS